MITLQHSGLQKEILAFIRQCLRACRTKPLESKELFHQYIMQKSKEYQHGIDKKDIQTIEYLLRRYKRQLETLKDPRVTRIGKSDGIN
jgi:succinate dehydrogenase assembly factor 1